MYNVPFLQYLSIPIIIIFYFLLLFYLDSIYS